MKHIWQPVYGRPVPEGKRYTQCGLLVDAHNTVTSGQVIHYEIEMSKVCPECRTVITQRIERFWRVLWKDESE